MPFMDALGEISDDSSSDDDDVAATGRAVAASTTSMPSYEELTSYGMRGGGSLVDTPEYFAAGEPARAAADADAKADAARGAGGSKRAAAKEDGASDDDDDDASRPEFIKNAFGKWEVSRHKRAKREAQLAEEAAERRANRGPTWGEQRGELLRRQAATRNVASFDLTRAFGAAAREDDASSRAREALARGGATAGGGARGATSAPKRSRHDDAEVLVAD